MRRSFEDSQCVTTSHGACRLPSCMQLHAPAESQSGSGSRSGREEHVLLASICFRHRDICTVPYRLESCRGPMVATTNVNPREFNQLSDIDVAIGSRTSSHTTCGPRNSAEPNVAMTHRTSHSLSLSLPANAAKTLRFSSNKNKNIV